MDTPTLTATTSPDALKTFQPVESITYPATTGYMQPVLEPVVSTTSTAKDAAVEALKTFFRNGILGGVVVAIGAMISGIHPDTGMIIINWGVVSSLFLFTALSAFAVSLDKFIHEWDGGGLIGF